MVLNSAGKTGRGDGRTAQSGEVDPGNAQHPFMLALLCGEAGQTDEVIAQLKKAVAIDPGIRARMVQSRPRAGPDRSNLPESIAALRHAEELSPARPRSPMRSPLSMLAPARWMKPARPRPARNHSAIPLPQNC